jgi:hypothetical protein
MIQNGFVKDKHAVHGCASLLCALKRMVQRSIVAGAQIAAKPHQLIIHAAL